MIGPGICGNPTIDHAIDIEIGFVVVDIDLEIVEIDFVVIETDLGLGNFEIDFGVVEIDFVFGIDFAVVGIDSAVASYNYYFVVNIVNKYLILVDYSVFYLFGNMRTQHVLFFHKIDKL